MLSKGSAASQASKMAFARNPNTSFEQSIHDLTIPMWHQSRKLPFSSPFKEHSQLTLSKAPSDLEEFAMSSFQSINHTSEATVQEALYQSSDASEAHHGSGVYSSQGIDRAQRVAATVFDDHQCHMRSKPLDVLPPPLHHSPDDETIFSTSTSIHPRLTSISDNDASDDIMEETTEDLLKRFTYADMDEANQEDIQELLQRTPSPASTTVSIKRKPLQELDSNVPNSSKQKRRKVKPEDKPLQPQYTTRSLRPRNEKQENPYRYDKAEHNLRQRNPEATEAEIRKEMRKKAMGQLKQKQKHDESKPVQVSKRKRADSSSSLSELDSEQFEGISRQSRTSIPSSTAGSTRSTPRSKPSIKDIAVRTRIQEIINTYQPLALSRVKDNSASSFVAAILSKWEKRLGTSTVDYFTISFPWLGEGENIHLEVDGDNQESYDQMLEILASSPPGDKTDAANHVYIDGYLKS